MSLFLIAEDTIDSHARDSARAVSTSMRALHPQAGSGQQVPL